MNEMVTLDEIHAAQQRIAGVAVRTPLYRLEREAANRGPNLRMTFTSRRRASSLSAASSCGAHTTWWRSYRQRLSAAAL